MSNGKKGILVKAYVNGNLVSHWTLSQSAYASVDNIVGMKWDTLNNLGSLYPPASSISEISSPNMGIGHWQWGNNLGTIKRFGKFSRPEDNDIFLVGQGVSSSAPTQKETIEKIKSRMLGPSLLAGSNCGYSPYGLGRNMLYYIEAYDRFYLICDPLKKKNVTNKSFMCPGLRHTNAATQYFWLGQPRNTYLERRPMYGPYAYQWRVKRHNRDRNGNGMSEGYYSMGYNTRYELMYDAPAIYGLYLKRDASSEYIGLVNQVKLLREKVLGQTVDVIGLKSTWFGEAGSEGTSRQYGTYTFSCDPTSWAYNKDMCDYVSAAKQLANSLDLRAYTCPEERLKKGECFDPCLSVRYGQGFFPGGKSQSLFGYTNEVSKNLRETKNLRLVAGANFKDDVVITSDEQSNTDGQVFFRSPINTPHARVWRGLMKIQGDSSPKVETVAGISPCRDGGSDHCNYITPTLHLDNTSILIGKTTAFLNSQNKAGDFFHSYDVRGVGD